MAFKKYNREEVIQHNSINDCWIIVYNQVYDITEFLKLHPGGSEILMSRAGEDASSFFQTRHGDLKMVQKRLNRYLIGELIEEDRIEESAFEEPFLEELVKVCQKKNFFKVSKERKRRFNKIRASLILLFFGLYISAFYLNLPVVLSILSVVCMGLIATSLFGLIAHEHTHREFPKNKILYYLTIAIWPVLWPFITRKALIYEHNSHHIKIGDPVYDYEVIGFSHFIRYSGDVEHRAIHKIQHRIAFVWYMLYANIITTVGGVFTDFWKNHRRKVTLRHNAGLLVTALFYVIIPSVIMGGWWGHFMHYLIFQSVLFSLIYMGAAINHFTPLANQPIPEEMQNKFGYYVCHNTSNFAPTSSLWFYLSGGFNIQVEHHLNAFVPVENLRDLRVVTMELCKKYNYPHVEFNTVRAMYSAHLNYLKNLSKKSPTEETLQEINNKKSYQAR